MEELKLNTKRVSTKNHCKRTVTSHIAYNSNEVWSWDVNWLTGTIKGKYYKLYLILDMALWTGYRTIRKQKKSV